MIQVQRDGRWEKGDKTMRSIFRDASASDLSSDAASIRSEINSFINSSTDVASNSGGARHFDLREFGNLINGEIRDTFSHWPKKHFSDDSTRTHNHDAETVSSVDDATPVKVATATTSAPVETKQAAVTEAPVVKAAASAAPATLAATTTTTSQTATAAASAASGFPMPAPPALPAARR